MLSVSATAIVLALGVLGDQNAKSIGRALLDHHANCGAFMVDWKNSGTMAGADAANLQQIAEQVPRAGVRADPVDGSKTCLFTEGVLRTDGLDSYLSVVPE